MSIYKIEEKNLYGWASPRRFVSDFIHFATLRCLHRNQWGNTSLRTIFVRDIHVARGYTVHDSMVQENVIRRVWRYWRNDNSSISTDWRTYQINIYWTNNGETERRGPGTREPTSWCDNFADWGKRFRRAALRNRAIAITSNAKWLPTHSHFVGYFIPFFFRFICSTDPCRSRYN